MLLKPYDHEISVYIIRELYLRAIYFLNWNLLQHVLGGSNYHNCGAKCEILSKASSETYADGCQFKLCPKAVPH